MPHKRNHRRSKKYHRRHRSMSGGKNMFGNSYETISNSSGSSGWKYVENVAGNLNQQYNNALMGNGSGNQLVLKPMAGGKRKTRRNRRLRRSRSRRGGSMIGDAIVPLGLLAIQQTYKKSLKQKGRK